MIAVSATVLAFAGCGGGGGLSKADYVAKADAVCRDATAKLAGISQRAKSIDGSQSQDQQLTQLKKVFAESADASRPFYTRLKALQPPASLKAKADKYVAGVKQGLDDLDALKNASAVADVQARSKQVNARRGSQQQLAREIGFKECSKQ